MNDNYKFNAYKSVERNTAPPRATEARVLSEAAYRLDRCRQNWDQEGNREEVREALKYNQKIWAVLQSAVAAADCPLPMETRASMLKISAFIDRQTFKAMAAPKPELLLPIIEINRGLAEGLRGKGPKKKLQRPILIKA